MNSDNAASKTKSAYKTVGIFMRGANQYAITVAFGFGIIGLLIYTALCCFVFFNKNENGEFDYFMNNGKRSEVKPLFISAHVILLFSMTIFFYSKRHSVNGMFRKAANVPDSKINKHWLFSLFKMTQSILNFRKFVLYGLFMIPLIWLAINTFLIGQLSDNRYTFWLGSSFPPALMLVIFCFLYVHAQKILHVVYTTDEAGRKEFPLQTQRNYKTARLFKNVLLTLVLFFGTAFVILAALQKHLAAAFMQLGAIMLLCLLGMVFCWDHISNVETLRYITDDNGFEPIISTANRPPKET